jgi:hypothetical protein
MTSPYANKWHSSPDNSPIIPAFSTRRSHGFSPRESPPPVVAQRPDSIPHSVSILMNSLRDHGLDEVSLTDLEGTSPAVISALWKLLSQKQSDLRQIGAERERAAKVSNDNKQLKTKNQRLTEQVERVQTELQSAAQAYSRKESEWKSKLEDLQRVRVEWEKCAVTYKAREKQYVAEIRKQEGEYERLHTRVTHRRSESVAVNRRAAHFPHNSSLVGN